MLENETPDLEEIKRSAINKVIDIHGAWSVIEEVPEAGALYEVVQVLTEYYWNQAIELGFTDDELDKAVESGIVSANHILPRGSDFAKRREEILGNDRKFYEIMQTHFGFYHPGPPTNEGYQKVVDRNK